MSDRQAEKGPLCDAQEPSPKPGFVAARGCWLARGHGGDHRWTPEPQVENGATPLPCCNYIEAVYDHDPEGPCEGTMQPGWPEYVCDTCRARCGSLAHPTHAFPPEQGASS